MIRNWKRVQHGRTEKQRKQVTSADAPLARVTTTEHTVGDAVRQQHRAIPDAIPMHLVCPKGYLRSPEVRHVQVRESLRRTPQKTGRHGEQETVLHVSW